MAVKPALDPLPDKTMLRVYDAEQKGATAFFRNRALLTTCMELFAKLDKPELRILFHASSIGAELYSFLVYWQLHGLDKRMKLSAFATDLNPQFLQYAQNATYPRQVLAGMQPKEQAFFESVGDEVSPQRQLRDYVSFLPPQSFVDPVPGHFDVICCLNAFTYVTAEQQAIALRNMANSNARYLLLNCFYPDSIEHDLTTNGYQPVLDNIEAIHNGWSERINNDAKPQPGTPEYTWVIPSFSKIEEYEYKYCSIFSKQLAAEQNS